MPPVHTTDSAVEQPQEGVPALAAVVKRVALVSDRPFIISSWISSMRGAFCEERGRLAPPTQVRMTPVVFARGQERRIKRLLDDPQTRVLCAVLADDPDTILGWACARGDSLQYVFVKTLFRRHGIAKKLLGALMPGGVRRYAVRTRAGDSYIVPMLKNAEYDPFSVDGEPT